MLFPETTVDGTCHFHQRVAAPVEGLAFSTLTLTYPQDRLEELIDGCESEPGFGPVDWAVSRCGGKPGYFLKRPIDVAGAALGLVLFSPVLLLTAVAVALTSAGPVIFRQKRLGMGGAPFVFYKFRSMTTGAADDLHRNYVEDLIKGQARSEADAGGKPLTYKMTADPRITRVGSWIRKTSIGELPQLWNVLKGDMSLVGPRPPIPYETENYQSWHLRRVLDVKPGLTGLWQIEGRSRVSFDDMVRMDIQYIQNCSLSLDLRILLRTVKVVL